MQPYFSIFIYIFKKYFYSHLKHTTIYTGMMQSVFTVNLGSILFDDCEYIKHLTFYSELVAREKHAYMLIYSHHRILVKSNCHNMKSTDTLHVSPHVVLYNS